MKSVAATIRMVLDTGQMSTGLQQVNREFGHLEKSAAKLVGAFGAGFAISAVMQDATRVVMDYSEANSKLAAILGVTKHETEALMKVQKELGASTKFTASQVADAQTELAKLGFTQKEIAQSTSGVLSLAASANIDLGRAAEIAGGALRGFGMNANQTNRVVDVMAASFTKSALDSEKFAESMKYVAPIANAAGIDIETTTAMLGKLSDSMISGSMGGTALKNLLSELSNENSDLSKEVGFAVRNSDDLIRAFDILATKNIDLSKATQLTDERSKAAFLTLVRNSDALKELTAQLKDSEGAAKKLADTVQDNLKGDLTKMRSAYEGLILSLEDGNSVLGATSRGLTQIGTASIDMVTKLSQGMGLLVALGFGQTHNHLKNFEEQNAKAITRVIKDTEDLIRLQSQLGSGLSMDDLYLQKLADFDAKIAANPKMAKQLEAQKQAMVDVFVKYSKIMDDAKFKEAESTNEIVEKTKEQLAAEKKAYEDKVELITLTLQAIQQLDKEQTRVGAGDIGQALQAGLAQGVISADQLRTSLILATQAAAGLDYELEGVGEAFNEMMDPVQLEDFNGNLRKIAETTKRLNLDLEKNNMIMSAVGGTIQNVLAQGMQDFENFGEIITRTLKAIAAELLATAIAAAILNALMPGSGGFAGAFKQISGGGIGGALGSMFGGVPQLAEGGVVTKPTLAMIGEGGESEAVIPLSKLSGMMGRGGNVNGMLRGRDIVITNERAGQLLNRIGR
jgi:TP901 family phage tail tape measure protein